MAHSIFFSVITACFYCLCLLLHRHKGVHLATALRVSTDSSLSWLSELWTTATSNHPQTSKLCVVIRESSLPDIVNSLFLICRLSDAFIPFNTNPSSSVAKKIKTKNDHIPRFGLKQKGLHANTTLYYQLL